MFVYQLEKLNQFVNELSQWIGVPIDQLINGNVATDKWVSLSYKQAVEEIQISEEYFERCYREPFVSHFYSESDIQKFIARLKRHKKQDAS